MHQRILAALVACSLVAAGSAVRTAAQQAGSEPAGDMTLGTVSLPRAVMADGQRLPAGTYDVRLTSETAKPDVAGQLPQLNRWVEFMQGDTVVGREVVSIVPEDDIPEVAQGQPPAAGTSSVEMLKDNEYLRVWIHYGGVHYFIHLPPA